MVLHHLHALDDVGLQVVGQLVIPPARQVHAFDVKLADAFPVVGNLSLVVHIHAGQLLQHILDCLVTRADELRDVIIDRVLPPVDASRTYLDLFQGEYLRFEAYVDCRTGSDSLLDGLVSQ